MLSKKDQLTDFEGTHTDTIGYQIELSEEFQKFSLLHEKSYPYVKSSGTLLDLSNIGFLQISILPDENGVYPNLNNETISIREIDFFEDGTTGMNDAEETESNLIYPNPTTGELNFQDSNSIEKIEVFNSLGNLIKTMNAKGTIENLPNGYYTFFIYREDSINKTKIIKI